MTPREYYGDFPVLPTVRDLILDGFERGGDKRQFLFEDEEGNEKEKRFSDVRRDTLAFAAFLRSKGLAQGDRFAILCENRYFWNVAFYACAVSGIVILPLDVGLAEDGVIDQTEASGCRAVFCSKKQKTKIDACLARESCPLEFVFTTDEEEKYVELGLNTDGADAAPDIEVKQDDLLAIVYTSGTTGRTKGIMLTHKNVCADVYAVVHLQKPVHGIGLLPLNHTFSWVSGLFATLVASQWGYICTNLSHVYRDIKKYRPYQFAAVPMMVEMIYQNIIITAKRNGSYDRLMQGIEMSRNFMLSGYDARREMFSEIHEKFGGNLETIYCAGAYLDPKIERFMFDIGIQVLTAYGLTECSPGVTCSRRYEYKFGSAGLPMECCEIRINEPDEDGVGEIYVRGDNVMAGYYNDPEATASVFDGEWLKTGDVGYIDEDGYLFFTGRKKNLIILSNGKNVSPEEIENIIRSRIEYVKEVVVSEKNGLICAEVFLDEEKYPDARDRINADVAEVNTHLPDYEQIQKIGIRDTEFPKTTTLKIKRGA